MENVLNPLLAESHWLEVLCEILNVHLVMFVLVNLAEVGVLHHVDQPVRVLHSHFPNMFPRLEALSEFNHLFC